MGDWARKNVIVTDRADIAEKKTGHPPLRAGEFHIGVPAGMPDDESRYLSDLTDAVADSEFAPELRDYLSRTNGGKDGFVLAGLVSHGYRTWRTQHKALVRQPDFVILGVAT